MFGIIDHGTFLGYLSLWFGVGAILLKWLKSYLTDRMQCVKIGCILSDAKKLLFSMPQGSDLGTILFFLYTSPLGKVI